MKVIKLLLLFLMLKSIDIIYERRNYLLSNEEITNYLKNLTIAELIDLLSNNCLQSKLKSYNNKKVYTTEELLIEYPMFSRYTLNRAIKEQNLPFYREGHKMYFEKELIDKWIKDRTITYNIKNKDKYRL